MIKNYDDFVNEGFLHDVVDGIESGIGAFKANRSAEKAVEMEKQQELDRYARMKHKYSDETIMKVLLKNLIKRAAYLADGFSYLKMYYDKQAAHMWKSGVEDLEETLSEIKELIPKHR